MKWIWLIVAIIYLVFYIIEWIYPNNAPDLANLSRGVNLALFLIYGHMFWGHEK